MKKIILFLVVLSICSMSYASMGFANLKLGMPFGIVDLIYDTELIEANSETNDKLYTVDISHSELSSDDEASFTGLDWFEALFSIASPISVKVDEINEITCIIALVINKLDYIKPMYMGLFYAYTAAYGFPEIEYDEESLSFDYAWTQDGQTTYISITQLDDETGMIYISVNGFSFN